MRNRVSIVLAAGLLAILAGCGVQKSRPAVIETADSALPSTPAPNAEPGGTPSDVPADTPAVPEPEAMSSTVSNPWFPLVPGTVRIYEGESDGESVRIQSTVTDEVRIVAGVACTVVHTVEFVDGDLAEETRDFYAQDEEGNVWYMGEETAEYEDGVVVGTTGTWMAGAGGARAGLLMPGNPQPGQVYQMEYLPGVAEDQARVESLETTVVLSDGSSRICLQTKEWDPNDPKEIEYKYYAPGEGLVKEEAEDGSSRLEVVTTATAE